MFFEQIYTNEIKRLLLYKILHQFPFILVDILLKATGDAPILKQKKWTVPKSKTVGSVNEFIKKYIKADPSESLVRNDKIFILNIEKP